MACGRVLTYPGKIGRYVGRAWVLKGVWCDSVTCKQCRKKYKLTMGETEEEAR
jgi:hypothetical protein